MCKAEVLCAMDQNGVPSEDPDPVVAEERTEMQQAGQATHSSNTSLKLLLDSYERQLIQTALSAAAGNQRRAAASLGLLPTTLHEKMKRLGLARPPRRAGAPAGRPPDLS